MAVLVGACSGGDDDDAGSSDKDDGSEESTMRTDGRDPTPLQEFWESLGQEEEAVDDEELREQQRDIEAQIVTCMQEQGFEYTPMEMPELSTPEELDDGPWNLPPGEFAERYGYGMFTMGEEEGRFEPEEMTDPNMERMEAMSEAERAAYEKALYGTYDEENGEAISEGCSGEAYNAVYGEDTTDYDEFNGLFEEMDAVWQRTEEDPRVEDARREWADCMADAGYPDLERPDDAQALVSDRRQELSPTEDGSGDEAVSSVSGSGEARVTYDTGQSDLDPDDLRELREYEIEVAVADYECQEAGYVDVQYEVQVELEEQFLDANREELERYAESIASQPGVG